MEYVIAIFGSLLSLLIGVLLAVFARFMKRSDKRHKDNIDREVLLVRHRAEETELIFEIVDAVQEKRCNGEVKKAAERFEKTNQDYIEFVQKQAGIQLANRK